jgi:hypothetical protein
MKWVLSHATDELHHWLLQQEENSRSLTLHLQRLSLRLNGFSKRLFFLQVQGFLQKKILLCSEYGVEIGEASFGGSPFSGQLTINGEKFFYEKEQEKLMLFDSEKTPVGDCEIADGTNLGKQEFYSLLFGFAWFVTADALVEKTYGVLQANL